MKKPLVWTRISQLIVVSAFRDFCYVLTREGQKRGRVTLTVGGECLAREVTPIQAKKIAAEHAELYRRFGRMTESLVCRTVTFEEMKFVEVLNERFEDFDKIFGPDWEIASDDGEVKIVCWDKWHFNTANHSKHAAVKAANLPLYWDPSNEGCWCWDR